jgi:hypothetical protein
MVSETESEDNRREATSVSPETTVERRIEGADVDWFAFDAESGQAVVAEFSRVRRRRVERYSLQARRRLPKSRIRRD